MQLIERQNHQFSNGLPFKTKVLASVTWVKINGEQRRLFPVSRETTVIGVAKTSFHNNNENVMELRRGESSNPLYISAIGIDLNEATERIRNMKGEFRIPTILKNLDQITKQP